MSQRQVIKEHARLFAHPNAERLELCKVGPFQLVVRKGQYADGDVIVVAPKDALLPAQYAGLYVNSDTGLSYLRGPESNRVAAVRLRGEESQGVILPPDGLDALPFGEDLSDALGIQFYEPPIPLHLAGETHSLAEISTANYRQHEVEQFGIYEGEFVPGEQVIVTEKLHGSQGVYYRNAEGVWSVTSKGLSQKRLGLLETDQNTYWQAARRTELFEQLDALFPAGEVQVFAEVVPVQKGFGYGQSGPTPFIFKLVLDGDVQPRSEWPEWLRERSAPVLYAGPYERSIVEHFREGQETVSGRALHIREGVVLTPAQPRRNHEGRDLSAKLISAAYAKKETGDELS
jgi:RNA ligase (TIGR02306 family)